MGTTENLMKCQKCNSENMGIGTYNTASGSVIHPWFCLDCGKRTTVYVKKTELKNYKITDVVFESEYKQTCERCGALGAELHHYAPRHLFDDYDRWATGYLCVPCHILWHRVVTPNMCKK